MGEIEQNIREAFSRVKKDFNNLKEKIEILDNKLGQQEIKINDILSKVEEASKEVLSIKNPSSTGNEGVRQTDRQTDRHLDTSKNRQENGDLTVINEENSSSTGNEGIRHIDTKLDRQTDTRQTLRHLDRQTEDQKLDQNLEKIRQKLDSIFLKLSKQELKLFLTIYQLEDESIPATTRTLSVKMQLSESCIRDHLSSLFRKNVPIRAIKPDNRTNSFSINPEFRTLNMKNKLIDIFYRSDFKQHTLFGYG